MQIILYLCSACRNGQLFFSAVFSYFFKYEKLEMGSYYAMSTIIILLSLCLTRAPKYYATLQTVFLFFLQTQHAVNTGDQEGARKSYKSAIFCLSTLLSCMPIFGVVIGAILGALRAVY